jgi:YbbR domain-containing protein
VHVPVRWKVISSPPAGYSVGNVTVDPNTVAVSGPSTAVQQVHDATVYIDLSQARYSIDSFNKPSLDNGQGVSAPASSHLTIDPQLVHVTVPIVPLRAYKSVPVLVSVRGNPKTGVGIASLQTVPAEVTIYGAPQTLAGISSIDASSISIYGRPAGTFKTHVSLHLPRGVSSRSPSVQVVARLAPVQSSSSLQIGVVPQNVSAGLVTRVKPASVLVTVVGPASSIRQAAGHLRAVVSVAGYGTGTFTVHPTVKAPRSLKVSGIYPYNVTVVLSRP